MPEWSFAVPPGVTVTLRASKRPALLARALGRESEQIADATLVLDLGGEIDTSAPRQSGRYKAIPWRYQRKERDGRKTIVFRSAALREYLALHIALLPALRELLLERDTALVVGAAFGSQGSATVLAGETGRGKTSALLTAAAHSGQVIGDEYVGISTSGEVTPVLRVLGLRKGTLAALPELAHRLSAQRRLGLMVASLVARISLGRLDPLVHVSPEEMGLVSTPGSAVPLSTLVWLDSAAPREPAGMSTADAVAALLGMSQAHDAAYGVPGYDATHWCETLSRGLERVRCFRAGAPLAAGVLASVLGVGAPGPAGARIP